MLRMKLYKVKGHKVDGLCIATWTAMVNLT
jgi:hypothetical protein